MQCRRSGRAECCGDCLVAINQICLRGARFTAGRLRFPAIEINKTRLERIESVARGVVGEIGGAGDGVCNIVVPVRWMGDLIAATALRRTLQRTNLIDGALITRQRDLPGVEQAEKRIEVKL